MTKIIEAFQALKKTLRDIFRLKINSLPFRNIFSKAFVLAAPISLLLRFSISKYVYQFSTAVLISIFAALFEFSALYFLSTAIASAFTNELNHWSQIFLPLALGAITSILEVVYFSVTHSLCKKVSQTLSSFMENEIKYTDSKENSHYLVKLNWRGCKAVYDTLKLAFRTLIPILFILACCIVLIISRPYTFLILLITALAMIALLFKFLIGRNTTRKIRFQSMVLERNKQLKEGIQPTNTISTLIDIAVIPEKSQSASNIFYQQMLSTTLLVGLLVGAKNIENSSYLAVISLFFIRQFIINIRTVILFLRQYSEDVHLLGSVLACVYPEQNLDNLYVLLSQQSSVSEEEV